MLMHNTIFSILKFLSNFLYFFKLQILIPNLFSLSTKARHLCEPITSSPPQNPRVHLKAINGRGRGSRDESYYGELKLN